MIYTKSKIIELKKTHSYKQLAELTGRKVGALKAMVSRASNSREDNMVARAFFQLPKPTASAGTNVGLPPAMPAQEVVTGDREVDAMLWLNAMVDTEHPPYIEQALHAHDALMAKVDAKDMERRYTQHLVQAGRNEIEIMFSSLGVAGLKNRASSAYASRRIKMEAAELGFVGEVETVPGNWAIYALREIQVENQAIWAAVQPDKDGTKTLAGKATFGGHTKEEADRLDSIFRSDEHAHLVPSTLSDCLHELCFWNELYTIVSEVERGQYGGELRQEQDWRRSWVESLLPVIKPVSKSEALMVHEWIQDESNISLPGLDLMAPITRNLLDWG